MSSSRKEISDELSSDSDDTLPQSETPTSKLGECSSRETEDAWETDDTDIDPGASMGGAVLKYLSKLPSKIKAALMIEDTATSCRYCRGPVVQRRNEFCSSNCAMKYWERLRLEKSSISGESLCSLPGCDKLCWVENDGKVNRYCSKTHAKEHSEMKKGVQLKKYCHTSDPNDSKAKSSVVRKQKKMMSDGWSSEGPSVATLKSSTAPAHGYVTESEEEVGMLDCRGVRRGICYEYNCPCIGYDGGSQMKRCIKCHHPPGRHKNLSKTKSSSSSLSLSSTKEDSEVVAFNVGFESICEEDELNMSQQQNYVGCQKDDGSQDVSLTDCSILSDADDDCCNTVMTKSDNSQQPIFNPQRKPFILQQSPVSNFEAAPLPTPSLHPSHSSPLVDQSDIIDADQNTDVPKDQQCKLPGCTKCRFVGEDGRLHDYCRRKHAHLHQQQLAQSMDPSMKCKKPDCLRPRHKQPTGDGYFDYCSISCRDKHQGKKAKLGVISASASVPADMPVSAAGYGTCSLPGCNAPKYRDPANGRIHDYCGRSHAYQALNVSEHPHLQPDPVEDISLSLVTAQETATVTGKFQSAWASRKGRCPTIDFVYSIINTKLKQRWTTYQQGLTDKTVEEHYHGTKLTCNITAVQDLCNDQDCGICGIARMGLDRRCVQKNIDFQRFGHGFYLAPNSSKCHDYTEGYLGYRAMLLCDVCPGKKYPLKRNDESLKGPPQGYDCVYGNTGVNLNFEEIVLYNPDAILPRYVIIYQKDGIDQVAKRH